MKKILVIDDDPGILLVVDAILTSRGFDVLTDSSCLDVPGKVKSYAPDLVLLDMRMPDKQGNEICKELKELYDIPVLLFSANSTSEQLIADCKADGFIAKPFDLSEFVNLINIHLN